MMADQKPTLEYERPGPAHKNRAIGTATSIIFAIAMLSVGISQLWMSYADGKPLDRISFASMCLFALISISALVDYFRKPQ